MIKMKTKIIVHIFGVFLCSLWISNCATIDKEATNKLATTGITLSNGLAINLIEQNEGLDFYIEARCLDSGLTGKPELTETLITTIEDIQKLITARKNMFDELSKVYTSLQALASYNAGSEMESAITDFTGALNSYAETLGSEKPVLSNAAGQIASMTGGIIIEKVQSAKIITASKLIRERLNTIVALMEAKNEKNEIKELSAITKISIVVMNERYALAKALWKRKMASPNSIFKHFIENSGFDSTIDKSIPASNDMLNAIEKLYEHREKSYRESIKSTYNVNVTALKELINQHVELEKGKPLNVETLKSYVEIINKYTGLIIELQKSLKEKSNSEK